MGVALIAGKIMGSPSHNPGYFEPPTPRTAPLRKTLVTRHALRMVIKRLFEQRQTRLGGARGCAVPMPFHVDPVSRGAPNWQIKIPAKCAHGCDFVLRGIQKELRGTYDLLAPAQKKRGVNWIVAVLVALSCAFYLIAWQFR